jgi:iron complex outermembrane receptor protein
MPASPPSGLTKADASLGDAYNAEGYWSSLSARGYTLDNRYNYRRDGLPINAETAIALDNKERLELLKGTSGLQAGTSAPGGLVNLVVKRPNGNHRQAAHRRREAGSVLGRRRHRPALRRRRPHRLAPQRRHERLDPLVRNTRGQRSSAGPGRRLAAEPDTLLQAEIESSHQRQPSVAGYSMLGDTVAQRRRHRPAPQPERPALAPERGVRNGSTASLRLVQALARDWRFSAHACSSG